MLENSKSCAVLQINTAINSIITISCNGVIVQELHNGLGWQSITNENNITYLCNITQFGEYIITNTTQNQYLNIVRKKILIDNIQHYTVSIFPPIYLLKPGDNYTDVWTKASSYNVTVYPDKFLLARIGSNTPYLGFYTTNSYDFTNYSKLCMDYGKTSSASNMIDYGTQTSYTGTVATPTTNTNVALDISNVVGNQYVHVANATGGHSIEIIKIWLEDTGYENIYR